MRDEYPEIDIIRPIHVRNNVYLGRGCIVLPGVTIGNNVVVGAGSIVTRDVPDNSLCVGVPARVIKSVDEYAVTAIKKGHPTKQMTPAEKKSYYTNVYRGG